MDMKIKIRDSTHFLMLNEWNHHKGTKRKPGVARCPGERWDVQFRVQPWTVSPSISNTACSEEECLTPLACYAAHPGSPGALRPIKQNHISQTSRAQLSTVTPTSLDEETASRSHPASPVRPLNQKSMKQPLIPSAYFKRYFFCFLIYNFIFMCNFQIH